jgi:magnesium transporter
MLNAFTCANGQPHRLAPDADEHALGQAGWIDLVSATPEEVERVQRVTGLQVPSEAALSEIETSSRLATRHGALYLSMPMLSVTAGLRVVSVGFVLSPDRLITIRFAPSRSFDEYAEQLPRGETVNKAAPHIFVGLMEAIVDRQADALEQVRADLEAVSHRIFRRGTLEHGGRKEEDAMLRDVLTQLGRIGDLISYIRESEVGAARIVPYVESMTEDWMPHELCTRLRTLRRDIESVSDFDTHLNDKLQFMLDATLGFINIAQNNVIKVLTIASVAGIPPVLFAGIWGMNFKNMPELESPWGYPFAWLVIILSTVIPLLIFRWRKWI